VLASTAPRIVPADRIADFERRGGPSAGAAARGLFERCAPEDFGPYMRHCLPLYMRRPLSDGAARAARSRFSLDVNRHFFAPGGEAWRMDLRSGLSSISCPTLVLSGIDDPMTPADLGREIAQAIPNSQFELFEQSSHGLMSDEPEKFAAVVSAFIGKCLR
jgi:proline iminopeptidase